MPSDTQFTLTNGLLHRTCRATGVRLRSFSIYTDEKAVKSSNRKLELEITVLRLSKPDVESEMQKVREGLIAQLAVQYIAAVKTLRTPEEREHRKLDFYKLGAAFGYNKTSTMDKIIKMNGGDDGKDGKEEKKEGDRPDTPEWPKLVVNAKLYRTYISGISSVLQAPGGKTEGRSNITIDTLFQVLHTPKWVKFYNKYYGIEGERPFIPALINDEMITFIKDTLRLTAGFNKRAKDAIQFAISNNE